MSRQIKKFINANIIYPIAEEQIFSEYLIYKEVKHFNNVYPVAEEQIIGEDVIIKPVSLGEGGKLRKLDGWGARDE